MSILKHPDPVKLVSSLLSAERSLLAEGIAELAEKHGKPDYISEVMAFDYTAYYTPEMGTGLKRRMVSFEKLISPDEICSIKWLSNETEVRHARDGKRRINIDPGYISMGHLLLATGKPYAHRPYLGGGVYGDITLVYRDLTFHPQEWTYPDYREPSMIGILKGIRDKYLKQLSEEKKDTGSGE